MKNSIINYLEKPQWLSAEPVQVTQHESSMLPWFGDERLAWSSKTLQPAVAVKIKEEGSHGEYYLQGVDVDLDGVIDFLVVLDHSGQIIENFIFKREDSALNEDKIIIRIKNREKKIIDDLLFKLGLNNTEQNIKLLKDVLLHWDFNIFTKPLTKDELALIDFLFKFDLQYFKTSEQLDSQKIEFVLTKTNNPWTENEIRAILYLLEDYKHLKTIEEAELVFRRLGGISKLNLIIHQGKYHQHLIDLVKNFDLKQKELWQSLDDTKKIIARLGL